MEPDWFLGNMSRYDAYDRTKSKVYLGEYAAHNVEKLNTLHSALAEAAYMTSLERNGDVVHLSSYAPLLARQGHTQWLPDLIYFTNTAINLSINYYVQQLFMTNYGDAYLSNEVERSVEEQEGMPIDFAFSSVRDSRTGDIILKFVNIASAFKPLHVDLSGVGKVVPEAVKTVLSGDPMAVNSFENPVRIEPKVSSITVAMAFDYAAPPFSLTVIRSKTGVQATKI
jgi:alpha-L-arabinofuranosidase